MNIAVVGMGRFGHYLSMKLMEQGHDLRFVSLENKGEEGRKVVAWADLVVFAVPISALGDALADYAASVRDDAIVMDVCTVKLWPLEIMRKMFANRPIAVVGTHPLFGPQSAPIIKREHKVAICPIQGNDDGEVGRLFNSLGATVILVSADEHDRQQCQQMMDHLLGRVAIAAGAARVDLSTKTHDLQMNIIDIIGGNSDQLFEDMNSYNPHARAFREKLLGAFMTIHGRLCAVEDIVRPDARAGRYLRSEIPA